MSAQDNPTIIRLPEDPIRKKQLELKLEEYARRLEEGDDAYRHPELQLKLGVDARYKHDVLERVLKNGSLNTWEYSRELGKAGTFHASAFQTACAVIDEYCKTGGERCIGGTGLPEVTIEA